MRRMNRKCPFGHDDGNCGGDDGDDEYDDNTDGEDSDDDDDGDDYYSFKCARGHHEFEESLPVTD